MYLRTGFFIIYCFVLSNAGFSQSSKEIRFNFDAYYKAFSSDDTVLFNLQLSALKKVEGDFKPAFLGAILMKKSRFMRTIKQKLDMFREGRDLLENSIEKDKQNAEYRFLRLATQENAPGFLNYNDNKKEDAELIISSFKKLPDVAQKFIKEYSSVSHTIKPSDFN